jgi:4-diphosphocytidyl-2-C-methyl-D-erythritol kinase
MAQTSAREMVHVRAPGKINVFLRVGALLDDGYHDVASAYQAVSLYEDIRAYPADDFSMTVTGSVDISGVPTDGSNLAIRAARLLAKHTKYRGGVRFEVEKNVPVAGGMGGGSADAAAALVACDALWGSHLSRDELVTLGSELGADVPFALMGGTAIGTGRGDRLSPALAAGHFEWVIVLSDAGLSTPSVYAELDAHRARHVRRFPPPHFRRRLRRGVGYTI